MIQEIHPRKVETPDPLKLEQAYYIGGDSNNDTNNHPNKRSLTAKYRNRE